MILKRQKNQLYETLQSLGFDVHDFRPDEDAADGNTFTLEYKSSGYRFTVRADPEHHGQYDCILTLFPLKSTTYEPLMGWATSFQPILSSFSLWLQNQVAEYIEEESIPDLWRRLSDAREAFDVPPAFSTDEAVFTAQEREAVKLSVEKFRALIAETFHPPAETMAVVSERLDYLSDAVDRLNRQDWRGIAISTVIGIATTLSLDTEQGRLLFGLLQQAFGVIRHLLS